MTVPGGTDGPGGYQVQQPSDIDQPLLHVEELRVQFVTQDGVLNAVNGVSFVANEGEVLGLVGESGCGKSVTAQSVMRLIPSPPGRIAGGKVMLSGRNLLEVSERDMRRIRGNEIAMIFQDPMTSLNPVLSVGRQIGEMLQLHKGMDGRSARARTVELLDLVGIPGARTRVGDYPHQFSGGMRQRVMIALALSCEPRILLADEPTTALDVTIQAQILDLLNHLRQELGMAVIMITHDLGVVAGLADRVGGPDKAMAVAMPGSNWPDSSIFRVCCPVTAWHTVPGWVDASSVTGSLTTGRTAVGLIDQ